jgi:hypothetical protein
MTPNQTNYYYTVVMYIYMIYRPHGISADYAPQVVFPENHESPNHPCPSPE